jgi:hypothetical protein
MISHPNRHQNDNDDTYCDTSESTVIARQGDACGRSPEILWKDVAGTFVSPVLIVTEDKIYHPQLFNFQRISR